MLFSLTAISTISAFLSALLTAKQDRVRGIVAYSTITQLSLALAGVISRDPEAIAGGLLHMMVNALGDTSILTGYTIYMKSRDKDSSSLRLAKVLIMIGFLNLFGLIPIVPGFWSKALMTKGFLDNGNIVGVTVVLISTGLCAIGYFRFAINILLREQTSKFKVISTEGRYFLNTTIFLLLIAVVLGLGIGLTLNPQILNIIVELVSRSIDVDTYIANTFNMVNR
jgi:formate hydrogenlyase subunit 3/multisubunit Na+/H+ antiporter MnhD subunit